MRQTLFILLFATALGGCVGEVQNAAKDTTISTTDVPESDLEFDGIFSAVPTANDKIEVYFYPAKGGSQQFSYQLYVGNQPDPVNVSEEVLEKDYRGLFRYTLNGLSIGTQYSIKVDVKDIKSGIVKSTKVSKAVYTFSNYVADFSGISAVTNASGVQALDSINVRWAHAAVPGGIFSNGDKPETYEIVIIDSTKLTPEAIDDATLGPMDGRITRTIQYDPLVTETMIRGLREDTQFYVAVRCIHEGSVDDPTNYKLRGERNHRYLQIKTLSQDAASIEYDPNAFLLNNNIGEFATSSFVATWGEFVGVFDHFRLYYAKSPNLAINTSTCAQSGGDLLSGDTLCKKIAIDQTSAIVGDLPPQVEYQGQLLACLEAYCEDYIAMPIQTVKTSSALASFTGVASIELAKTKNDIGSLTLRYPSINFATGFFDGLAIEFTTEKNDLTAFLNGDGDMPQSYLIGEEESAAHDLIHDYFDYQDDDSITIRGLNYVEEKDYCFAVYPFNYDASQPDGKLYYNENPVWQCKKVEVVAPDKNQFTGPQFAYTIDNDIELGWNPPSRGVYSHFEVFYREASGAGDLNFDFYQAIQDTTLNFDFSNYQRVVIGSDAGIDGNGDPLITSSYSISNVPNGYYLLGVLTYFNGGVNNVKRSELNEEIYQCYVSGATGVVDCQKI